MDGGAKSGPMAKISLIFPSAFQSQPMKLPQIREFSKKKDDSFCCFNVPNYLRHHQNACDERLKNVLFLFFLLHRRKDTGEIIPI